MIFLTNWWVEQDEYAAIFIDPIYDEDKLETLATLLGESSCGIQCFSMTFTSISQQSLLLFKLAVGGSEMFQYFLVINWDWNQTEDDITYYLTLAVTSPIGKLYLPKPEYHSNWPLWESFGCWLASQSLVPRPKTAWEASSSGDVRSASCRRESPSVRGENRDLPLCCTWSCWWPAREAPSGRPAQRLGQESGWCRSPVPVK